MNSLRQVKTFKKLSQRQRELEQLPVCKRDHGAIAWVLERRLGLLAKIARSKHARFAAEQAEKMRQQRPISN